MANINFIARNLTSDTYVISGDGCDCYLLLADEEAIMIDAGQSEDNIRAFAETLTDLPVRKVINTHSHFDHTGGNGYFDIVYGTEGIAKSAKNIMDAPSEALYPLDYRFTIVHDGDILDIKGRPLTLIELDCHAPGNLAILDTTRRILFPGDELECAQVLLLPGYAEEMGQFHAKPAASVETYRNAMLKLKAHEDDFDMICPGHNGTPIAKSYLDRYIALAEAVMNGFTGSTDLRSRSYDSSMTHFPYPDAGYRRAELDGCSLVYQESLIFDRDYVHADALPVATPLHRICSTLARQ